MGCGKEPSNQHEQSERDHRILQTARQYVGKRGLVGFWLYVKGHDDAKDELFCIS